MGVVDTPVACAASRVRKGFVELMATGVLDPVVCGVIDASLRDIQAACTRIENILAPGVNARARMEEGESKGWFAEYGQYNVADLHPPRFRESAKKQLRRAVQRALEHVYSNLRN